MGKEKTNLSPNIKKMKPGSDFPLKKTAEYYKQPMLWGWGELCEMYKGGEGENVKHKGAKVAVSGRAT